MSVSNHFLNEFGIKGTDTHMKVLMICNYVLVY